MRKKSVWPAALLAASLVLSGCSQLVPERPRPLLSDEQAGDMDIYRTDEADIHRKLEEVGTGVTDLLLDDGSFRETDLDEMNREFHDVLFLPGDRQILTMTMPGDGAASFDATSERIIVAMTGDAMTCWGLNITPEVTRRGAVFAPGCSAEDLEGTEWAEEWPPAPEPVSSEESIEFGTRPRG